MTELLAGFLILTGSAFILVAGIGCIRFPDFYTRMHAVSKASTLGLGCMLLALALQSPSAAVLAKVLVVAVLNFLTVPIAIHLLARAAHRSGVPLWSGSIIDRYRDLER